MPNSYSFNELINISNAIDAVLKKSKQEKYDRKLVYGLNKNLKIIQSEIETLQKQIIDAPEGYSEYMKKLQELAVNCGGLRETKNQQQVVNIQVEGFDKEDFNAKSELLLDEYKEIVDKAQEISNKNDDFMAEKIAEVEWFSLIIDWFPDKIDMDEMPYEITDLISVE